MTKSYHSKSYKGEWSGFGNHINFTNCTNKIVGKHQSFWWNNIKIWIFFIAHRYYENENESKFLQDNFLERIYQNNIRHQEGHNEHKNESDYESGFFVVIIFFPNKNDELWKMLKMQ